MTAFLIILHVIVCIALIVIVLLQAGKGAEIGASFGAGASQTVFGAAGGKNFMSKLTTAAAVIFMLTSLTLTIIYSQSGPSTIMPTTTGQPAAQPPAPAAPAEQPATPATPAESPAAQPAGEAQKN